MKRTSAALRAHFAQPYQTTATCLQVTLSNGTVLGFTDHDVDITIAGWVAPEDVVNGTYVAAQGYTLSDVATSDALNVDNTEVSGILQYPGVTEADLKAGLWDFARIRIFLVNWADLTMGPSWLRAGRLGEVTVERGMFKAELRGLMNAYTRNVGELTSPTCRAQLYDARCTVNPTGFTVTGTLTGISDDQLTLFDSGRTEPGPTGTVPITGITNANPGVVTFDPTLVPDFALTQDQPIAMSQIVGPTLLNTITVARNPTATTFELTIDTSDTGVYPPYVGSGILSPLGGNSGYFDHGVITITSGANNGLSMEVKSYVPGQWTLQLPFPYALSGTETYSMKAGCDKAKATCKNKFSNLLNFRGEPDLRGNDALMQVGRHK